MKKTYDLDGSKFTTLEEFYEHFGDVFCQGGEWGGNLDAFNDWLREEECIIHWKNSDLSRKRLGYEETVRQLTDRIKFCHPSFREQVVLELEAAKNRIGPTVFDWLVKIIREHGTGGLEEKDGVDLILE